MKKTLIDFAPELAIINADLSTTYAPDAIANSGFETLRIAICNRIMNNRLVEMNETDIITLTGLILNISDDKMVAYRKALVNYSEVLHS